MVASVFARLLIAQGLRISAGVGTKELFEGRLVEGSEERSIRARVGASSHKIPFARCTLSRHQK